MKFKLLVVVTVLKNECFSYKDSIVSSLSNLSRVTTSQIKILFIIQSDEKIEIPNSWLGFCPFVLQIPESSLSKARNEGIKFAKSHDFDFILFHDASIVFSNSFCKYIQGNLDDSAVLSGKLLWNLSSDKEFLPQGRFATINIMKNHYIGSYIIPVKMIGDLKFSEKIGPGKDTDIKNGEDVLFLLNLFSKNKTKRVLYSNDALILHPPRPRNRSKEVYYAKGQGALYRFLIHEKIWKNGIIFYMFLFWANAFLSLFFRKKGFKVLTLRLKGFFSSDYKYFYE